MLRHTFSWRERLHLQKDFQSVLTSGKRLSHSAVIVYVHRRGDASPLRRMGLITSRKVGTAVERNRVKRRLREIFRLAKHDLEPGVDIIFVPRTAATARSSGELRDIVFSLWKKAGVFGGDTPS